MDLGSDRPGQARNELRIAAVTQLPARTSCNLAWLSYLYYDTNIKGDGDKDEMDADPNDVVTALCGAGRRRRGHAAAPAARYRP